MGLPASVPAVGFGGIVSQAATNNRLQNTIDNGYISLKYMNKLFFIISDKTVFDVRGEAR